MKKLILSALFFVSLLQAQNPADIDLTFNHKDEMPALDLGANKTILQPDGKIISVGGFDSYYKYDLQRNMSQGIVRLNSDLTIDKTFNCGSGFTFSGINVNTVIAQPDGKLLVGGGFTAYNGTPVGKIVRLNNDGSLDTTFNTGTVFTGYAVNAIALQTDGKIMVGGNFGTGQNIQLLVRLNSDGSQDNSFTVPVPFSGSSGGIFHTINLMPDGKILAGGYLYDTTITDYNNRLLLFNPDGSVDNSFNMVPTNFDIRAVTIQPDNKILAVYSTSAADTSIKRLNADGSADPTFDTGSGFTKTGANAGISNILLKPNGDIIVFGYFDKYNGITVKDRIRINANGVFDPTFNYLASDTIDWGFNGVMEPDGNMVGLYFVNNQFDTVIRHSYTRLDSNGYILDNQQPITRSIVSKLVKKSDNEIMALGTSQFPGVLYHNGIKLLQQDGNLNYNPNLKAPMNADPGYVNATVQPDGKVLFIGKLPQNPTGKLMRFNADFSTDSSFNLDVTLASSRLTEIKLQSDGKILVVSTDNLISRVTRLNSDGSIDTSFSFGQALASEIKAMEILPDGKILIGGDFILTRLNADGSSDSSFITPFQGVSAMAIQSDSKIVVGVYGIGIYRLNDDGSPDPSFSPPTMGGIFHAIAIQADGKILVGGRFDTSNGTHGIIRLNSNGTLDPLFDAGLGFANNDESFNTDVNAILVEADGTILVGGSFTKYNGTYCNGVIRLLGGDAFLVSGQSKIDLGNDGCDAGDIVFPNMKFQLNSGAVQNDYIANISGNYAIGLLAGTHTITPIIENPNLYTISPSSLTVTFPSQSTVVNQSFCITPNGIHPDLEIYILSLNVGRPGFDAEYKIVYKNKGNQIQSGTIGFNFDEATMDFTNANPTVATQTSGSLTWNFTNLLPMQSREILVTVNLNGPTETPPLNIWSLLQYTATATSTLTDDTPADNTFVFHQFIVNSYDPNDKTCLEGATVGTEKIGDYVHYMIRFENKGTYSAQNVSVKDVIDTDKFDINTLIPLSGSHLFVTRITEGNKVEFYFEDINLPFADATNDGYVSFKIKTKPTLVSGDTFSNSAAIYFDYNSAVDTNTATTAIAALAVKDFAFHQYFTVYPNPADNQLHIDKKQNIEITSLSVFNTLGQLMLEIPSAQNTSTLDVSGLKSGNYFLRINSDKGISNTKFIKL